MRRQWQRLKRDRGAGVTEYVIIIVIVAIAIGMAWVGFRSKMDKKVDAGEDTVESTAEQAPQAPK